MLARDFYAPGQKSARRYLVLGRASGAHRCVGAVQGLFDELVEVVVIHPGVAVGDELGEVVVDLAAQDEVGIDLVELLARSRKVEL